jgi:hypothetical protein
MHEKVTYAEYLKMAEGRNMEYNIVWINKIIN